MVQAGDSGKKEIEEEVKRLRKRNADLCNLMKSMDERVQGLKLENKRVVSDQVTNSVQSFVFVEIHG